MRPERRRRGLNLLELTVAAGLGALILLVLSRFLASASRLAAYGNVCTSLNQEELIWWQRMARDLHGCSFSSLALDPPSGPARCLCLHSLAPSTFLGLVRYANGLTSYSLAGSVLTRREHKAPIPHVPVSVDHPVCLGPTLFPNLESVITRSSVVSKHVVSLEVHRLADRRIRLEARFEQAVPGRDQPYRLDSYKTLRLENP